jgi:hypothetical protein
MNRFFILLILALFISCKNDKTQNTSPVFKKILSAKSTEKINLEQTIEDRLKIHFELNRITPSIIINNTENNQTEIQLSNHKIKWLNTDNETKIRIDNDLFTLKDKVTLNKVREDNDSIDFANNWDEIKLYKHNDREYIGIRMSFVPCTGLACSVNYYLIYDIKTKTKSFFGTFRTDNELELFDFGNDDKIDYVSKTYIEQNDGVTEEIINFYELYSMEINGKFNLQVDSRNKPYFIKRTFNAETDKEIEEKFEQHWITNIK